MQTKSYPEQLVAKYRIKTDQRYKQNRDASPSGRDENGDGIGGIGKKTYDAARFYAPKNTEKRKKNWGDMPVIVAE